MLIGENTKKRRVGDTLQDRHEGPFTLTAVSSKGVATVRKGTGKFQISLNSEVNFISSLADLCTGHKS